MAIAKHWENFSFLMASLGSPILLAVRKDFTDVTYDLVVILIPISVSWILILLALLLIRIQIKKDYEYI